MLNLSSAIDSSAEKRKLLQYAPIGSNVRISAAYEMVLRVALIGSGIFAKEAHLPAIQACSELQLTAIYSRSLISAKSLAEGLSSVELYSDDSNDQKGYDQLLEKDDIDAVILCLPINVQPEFIRKALTVGKHVISEKPIARDVAAATELIEWYGENIDRSKVTWCVAENFRYLESFLYAAEQVKSLGRVLGFQVKVHNLVPKDGKYFLTPWRNKPEYQGGFILDGGVHFAAATRLLLEHDSPITRVSAFTSLTRDYLPPVDTFAAVLQTQNGMTGTFSVAFGTTFKGSEYAVACEGGSATVSGGKITVVKGSNEEEKNFPGEGSGVKQEFAAWAEGLKSGKMDPRQSPEEALKDLKVIEAILTSGDQNGTPVDI